MVSLSHPGIDFPGITIVFFCHDGAGRFLMGKRSEHCRDEQGKWDIGAGRLELHDSVEHRLQTEIKEEYGTDAQEWIFLGYRELHRTLKTGEQTHWVGLDFAVVVDPKLVRVAEPEKIGEVKWFTSQDIPTDQLLHSQLPLFLRNHQQQLKQLGFEFPEW